MPTLNKYTHSNIFLLICDILLRLFSEINGTRTMKKEDVGMGSFV